MIDYSLARPTWGLTGEIPTDQRSDKNDHKKPKEKKSSSKYLLQKEEVFLLIEKVNLDIQGEPRSLGNGLTEHRLILILIYMASPEGELLLMGISSFSKYW